LRLVEMRLNAARRAGQDGSCSLLAVAPPAGIECSTSPAIHSRNRFATGLVDRVTRRLKPASVTVVTDCTLPLLNTVAWLIHRRPSLANRRTGDGSAPLGRKTTVMVVWIPVAAMSAVTPWQNKPGTMFPSGWVGPASDPVCGDIAAFQV
jgi:hypothetical protein